MYLCKFGGEIPTGSEEADFTGFFTFQSASVTLKIRSRSPKSNQLLSSSQQFIFVSLVKIHPLVQKLTHRNPILDISKCRCDLENKVKVTKI